MLRRRADQGLGTAEASSWPAPGGELSGQVCRLLGRMAGSDDWGKLGAQEGDRINLGTESFGRGELMGTEVEGRTLAKGRDSLSLVQAGSGAAVGTVGKAGMGRCSRGGSEHRE